MQDDLISRPGSAKCRLQYRQGSGSAPSKFMIFLPRDLDLHLLQAR